MHIFHLRLRCFLVLLNDMGDHNIPMFTVGKKKERMEGMEKEEAIDNERRTIRDDLSR